MKKFLRLLAGLAIILVMLSFSSCAGASVGIGVGVYVPGAWVGPYGGAVYPPIGIGYPIH